MRPRNNVSATTPSCVTSTRSSKRVTPADGGDRLPHDVQGRREIQRRAAIGRRHEQFGEPDAVSGAGDHGERGAETLDVANVAERGMSESSEAAGALAHRLLDAGHRGDV